MGLRDLPADKASFDRCVQTYEQCEMVFNETNARVAQATLAGMGQAHCAVHACSVLATTEATPARPCNRNSSDLCRMANRLARPE